MKLKTKLSPSGDCFAVIPACLRRESRTFVVVDPRLRHSGMTVWRNELIWTIMIISISLFSLSCRHLPPQRSPVPIEDLHIYEDVSFSESPFEELIKQTFQNNTHHISILNVGDEALLARIHLIRAARKAIYIQTFIWTNDETGRLVIKELVQAAGRGVKVKLMVDYLTLDTNLNNIAYLATIHPNIEFKVYNPIARKIRPSALHLIKGYGSFYMIL